MKLTAALLLFMLLTGCGGVATLNKNTAPANVAFTPDSTAPAKTVTIDSPDGLKIVGSFFASSKPNAPALLLLHQWESDRHSFDGFAKLMQSVGFAVLSIDGRGFGNSTKKTDGSGVAAGRTEADVKAMLGDVGAAFDFLSKQENVDPAKIGIIGASYGSSLAIIYAADNAKVAVVGLLSPGMNYFGNMQIKPALDKYGQKRPLIFMASKDDPDSNAAAEQLMKQAATDSEWAFESFDKGGHGTAMFSVGADRRLEKFLIDKLGGDIR